MSRCYKHVFASKQVGLPCSSLYEGFAKIHKLMEVWNIYRLLKIWKTYN
uniref:Uncharacterized protein n=1 Tax=Triticum urartu TaxID=4572 RepID=A0A8R7QXN6_TRIUA